MLGDVDVELASRRHREDAEDALRVVCSDVDSPGGSTREGDEDGVAGVGGVHDGDGVRGVLPSAYAAAPDGRSERPLPRPSYVTTRKCRARYPTWAFQTRECTMLHAGISSTVVSPPPYTS